MVRRSAHIRPRPLQNVATLKRSANRGKRSTLIRAASHDPDRRLRQARVRDVGIRHVLQPPRDRVEADAPGRR